MTHRWLVTTILWKISSASEPAKVAKGNALWPAISFHTESVKTGLKWACTQIACDMLGFQNAPDTILINYLKKQ